MAAPSTTQDHVSRPPRDGLVRALLPGIEVRNAESDTPTLFGHFAVFNRWTEIDSWFEGNFMERIAPGALKKTFREQRNQMRVLLQHGRDPQLGDKPIASITDLREDAEGGYYEADVFSGIPELVLDGLRAGVYGASFRFRVVREEFNEEPKPSDANPKGIPERTIKEMQVFEFGPVTFPAYPEATAGVRSLTDAYFFGRLAETPPDRLRSLFRDALTPAVTDAVAEITDDETETEDVETRDVSDEDVAETRDVETEEVPETGDDTEVDASEERAEGSDDDDDAAERVTERPWDGTASRFTDAQYERSCVYDLGGDGPVKDRYSLPIREPSGALNRNAVHAAVGRLGSIEGSDESLSAAKAALRSAYKQLGEDEPSSLQSLTNLETSVERGDKETPQEEDTATPGYAPTSLILTPPRTKRRSNPWELPAPSFGPRRS